MGKKYIIELKDDELAYQTIIIDGTPYIKPLQLLPYTEPDLEQVRKEAYDKCRGDVEMLAHKLYSPKIDGAYQRGLNDAWDAARKICYMDSRSRDKIFGAVITATILEHNSASEAIERIRKYEQKKQFHIGDEIETQNGFKGFVIREDDKYVYFVDENGEGCVETMMAAKTGRHFPEIAEVLNKMRKE